MLLQIKVELKSFIGFFGSGSYGLSNNTYGLPNKTLNTFIVLA